MATLIEKDSPLMPLLILAAVFLAFVGSVVGLAYVGGVFTGENAVRENDARITRQHLAPALHSPVPKPVAP